VPRIRLIDEDGTNRGEFGTTDAIIRAESLGMDLVELDPNAKPPVCKIMDYGQYKYEMKKRARRRSSCGPRPTITTST
jgi:translation initiation factor IF-3